MAGSKDLQLPLPTEYKIPGLAKVSPLKYYEMLIEVRIKTFKSVGEMKEVVDDVTLKIPMMTEVGGSGVPQLTIVETFKKAAYVSCMGRCTPNVLQQEFSWQKSGDEAGLDKKNADDLSISDSGLLPVQMSTVREGYRFVVEPIGKILRFGWTHESLAQLNPVQIGKLMVQLPELVINSFSGSIDVSVFSKRAFSGVGKNGESWEIEFKKLK